MASLVIELSSPNHLAGTAAGALLNIDCLRNHAPSFESPIVLRLVQPFLPLLTFSAVLAILLVRLRLVIFFTFAAIYTMQKTCQVF